MRASGQVDGSITCDPDNVGASSVEVVFPLAGLSSHVADFDEHLRSACFFDTGNFPHTTFKRTSVRRKASTRLPRSNASTSTWACSCRTYGTDQNSHVEGKSVTGRVHLGVLRKVKT